MKIKIEVDCSPEEMRKFFGLPEVAPMQDRLLAESEDRLRSVINETDVSELIEKWLPVSKPGLEQLFAMWSSYATKNTKNSDG